MKGVVQTQRNKTVPAAIFCWECGRKFRGKFIYIVKCDGLERRVHKICGEKMYAEGRAQGCNES